MAEEKTQKQAKPAEKSQAVNQEPEKISYERLSHIAGELQMQNKQLIQRAQQLEEYISSLDLQNLFAFLNSLFKVVEHSEMYDVEFVSKCISDVGLIVGKLHSAMLPHDETKGEEGDETKEEEGEE